MRPTLLVLALIAVASSASAQPTFSNEVSRIMQGKCQRCHRPDDIAPMALISYDDASTWAEDIKRVLSQNIMPPWKPVPGHGDFQGSYGLTPEERQTILDWIDAGAPQGDPAQMPDPLPDTGEWQLGYPDLVLQMPQVFDVPRVKDTYRCFVIPTGLDEDKYVNALQVLPGNKQIVHHVLLFLDTSGAAEKLDGADGYPGYPCYGGPGFDIGVSTIEQVLSGSFGLGGWVPGSQIFPLPDDVGIFLPKEAKVVMQVHYFPNGRPGPDQTKLGLYFSKKPVDKRLRYLPLVNTTFKIQPGEADKVVIAEAPLPLGAHLVNIAPHMHLLGTKIKVELQPRSGDPNDLILINDWDFNWQGFYNYKEPVALPFLSKVRLTCDFNNTEDNPRNPNNPLKTVGWGEGTEDEMCLAFLGVTLDVEHLNSGFNLKKIR